MIAYAKLSTDIISKKLIKFRIKKFMGMMNKFY